MSVANYRFLPSHLKKSKEKIIEKRCRSSPFREGVPLLVTMAVEEEADVVLVVLWPGRAEETEEEEEADVVLVVLWPGRAEEKEEGVV